jgi:hypothetical protein
MTPAVVPSAFRTAPLPERHGHCMSSNSTQRRLTSIGSSSLNRRSRPAWGSGILERAVLPVLEGLERRQLLSASYPAIVVQYGVTAIAYQDATPAVLDGTDFGNVDTKKNLVETFTIKNTGVGTLNLTAFSRVQVTGANAADFTVTAQPAVLIAPAGQSTFSLKFVPTTTSLETAVVTIDNDTENKNPFTFTVQGTGVQAPKAVITGNAKVLPVNDQITQATDNTLFGTVESASGTVSKTFTIKNTGSGVMTLAGTPKVAISGADAAAFSVTTQPSGSIAAGASSDFVIKFLPGTAGTKNALVTVTTDDASATSYKFKIQGIAVNAQVFNVQGASTDIASGDTTPTSGDGTDFGSADLVTGTVTRTFALQNIGSSLLTLKGVPFVAITGDGKSAYSVLAQPTATIAAGANQTVQIRFAPGSIGVKNAVVNIVVNDGAAGINRTYTFAITGNAVSLPKIDVQGGLTPTDLTSGQTTTGAGDGTDFGSIDIGGSVSSHTLTIKNLGSGTLNLSGSPIIAISGADAADFTVTAQPADAALAGKPVTRVASLPPQVGSSRHERHLAHLRALRQALSRHEQHLAHLKHLRQVGVQRSVSTPAPASAPNLTTFTIKFDPTTAGVKNALVTIASNDPNVASFTFAVSGTATSVQILNVTGGVGNLTISTGDVTPSTTDSTDFGTADTTQVVSHTFTLTNLGSQTLNIAGTPAAVLGGVNASDFTIFTDAPATLAAGATAPLVVKFNPTTVGTKTATITLASDDASSPYVFTIKGTAVSIPIVEVDGNSTAIVAGDTTPASGDFTDFGNAELALGAVSRTFTIKNTGSALLSLTGAKIRFDGIASADYTLMTPPAATVAAGASTTFVVKFDPSATGVRGATISVLNNGTASPTYTYAVQGTGVRQPAMVVSGKSVTIAAGALTATSADGSDFGNADPGEAIVRTFTIRNPGSEALNITSVAITGADAADFTVSTKPRVSLAAGASTTFQVSFTPSTALAEVATLTIASDHPTTPSFAFALGGTGIAASLMSITGGGPSVPIVSGDVTPQASDGTDFGQSVISTGTVSNTFTIKNTGSAILNLSGSPIVVIGGANAADFTVTAVPSSTVAATNGTTVFVVKFAPSAAGVRTATITIASDDSNSPFTFTIRGSGVTAPSMQLQGNGITIVDGDTTPDTSDASDFGDTELTNGTVTQTFTIRNTGSASMTLTGTKAVVIGGVNAADFTVVLQPDTTIAAGASKTFQVKFKPSAAGVRNATVTLASNDLNTSPYVFSITGNAITQPVMSVLIGTKTLVSGQIASTVDGSDFGSAKANDSTLIRTITIKNTGSAVLNLSGAIDISGSDAADFAVTTPPGSTTLAAGASTTFVITFTPTAIAAENAVVGISSDDPNGTFTFNIKGTGTLA